MIATLADILAPISTERFFAEHHDRQPLHVAGNPDKFAAIMSWPELSRLLNITAIWSSASLNLVIDKGPIAPAEYCRAAAGRDGREVLQPDAERVIAWLRRGATMVANDIDTLSPALADAAQALEAGLGGKAQANLYCSWQGRQGFDTHFDTHDVFALHIAGEKRWRVYRGRLDAPVNHPAFKRLGPDYHSQHRGEVQLDVTLKPGDLLYIPRGQYHEAVASSEGTIHIAFGVTQPIGLDLLNLVLEAAVQEPLLRRNLPRRELGPDAEHAHNDAVAARLAEIVRSPAFAERLGRFRDAFRYPRLGYNLPADATDASWRVRASGLSIVDRGGQRMLSGRKGAVPIPPGAEPMVRWAIGRERFSRSDFAAAFPGVAAEARSRLLGELEAMRVIEAERAGGPTAGAGDPP